MVEPEVTLHEVIAGLEVGVCVWELTRPGDRESLVLRVCNQAAGRFLSVEPSAVLGKFINEGFPGALETPLPSVFTKVIESGETMALGDVPYKDEVVPDGVFSILVRPISHNRAVVEFTNVTQERRAQNDAKAKLEEAESARAEANRFARSAKELDEKLQVIGAQKREILTLTAPIIEVWTGVLAVPLAGHFDGNRSQVVREKLLEAVSSTKARRVIIDLTGLGVVDELTASELLRLTTSLGMLGAKAYLTGISPANAQTISNLSQSIPPGMCVRTLKDALRVISGGGQQAARA